MHKKVKHYFHKITEEDLIDNENVFYDNRSREIRIRNAEIRRK